MSRLQTYRSITFLGTALLFFLFSFSFAHAADVSLLANGQSALTIAQGQSYTLSWSSSGVVGPECTILYASAAASGSLGVVANSSGSGTSGLIGSYTLTCQDPGAQ